MPVPYRVLLTHPKNISDEEINELADEARGTITAALPDRDETVTP